MIQGDSRLSESLSVRKPLEKMSISTHRLLSLFDKLSLPKDRNFAILWRIIHSPLTPDSLEGIWRCSRSFKVKIKRPETWIKVFKPGHLLLPYIRGQGSIDAEAFWRGKSYIYNHFINRPDVVKFESSWSQAIKHLFRGLTLSESLLIPEETIIEAVLRNGIAPTSEIVRYKNPLQYTVLSGERRTENFKDLDLDALDRMLLKQQK